MRITKNESCVLKLTGRLDIRRAEELRESLVSFANQGRSLVVDLSAVETCDATAVQLLCSIRKTLKQKQGNCSFMGMSSEMAASCASLGFSFNERATERGGAKGASE